MASVLLASLSELGLALALDVLHASVLPRKAVPESTRRAPLPCLSKAHLLAPYPPDGARSKESGEHDEAEEYAKGAVMRPGKYLRYVALKTRWEIPFPTPPISARKRTIR
jgi:hypothetical protein